MTFRLVKTTMADSSDRTLVVKQSSPDAKATNLDDAIDPDIERLVDIDTTLHANRSTERC